MDIKVICADCGRHIGTFIRLGKKQDTVIEIHACYHKDIYDHIQEKKKQIQKLEAENKRLREILAREVDDGRAEVDDIGIEVWIEQALKALQKHLIE